MPSNRGLMLDQETEELVVKAVSDGRSPTPFPTIPTSKGINGYVARTKMAILVADASQPPEKGLPEVLPSNVDDRSFAVAPIMFAGQYYGNLALSHSEPHCFVGRDLKLIDGLARQLGLTLQRLEQLKAQNEAERKAHEELMMSHAGRQALDVTHRLSNDLGWIPNRIKSTRKRHGAGSLGLADADQLFKKICGDVSRVLGRSSEIAEAIQEGRGIERVTISVKQLVEDALEGLKVRDGIEVRTHVAPNSGNVRVSYKGITEAIFNLAKNAVEAMPDGGRLSLRIHLKEGTVEIRVADTGIGIPREDQKRLFEFGTTSDAKASSGIGLASAQRHVRMDRGEIALKSSSSGGTTFVIRLPAWSL